MVSLLNCEWLLSILNYLLRYRYSLIKKRAITIKIKNNNNFINKNTTYI